MLADTPRRCSTQVERGPAAVITQQKLLKLPSDLYYQQHHRNQALTEMPRRKQDKPQHLEEDGDKEPSSNTVMNNANLATDSRNVDHQNIVEQSEPNNGDNQASRGHLKDINGQEIRNGETGMLYMA